MIRKERNVLFNDALITFYLHIVKNHSDSERRNPLPPHGLLFRLAARIILYTPSHRQDNTCHGLCYTSRGILAGKRNSSVSPPSRIDPTTYRTISGALSPSYISLQAHNSAVDMCTATIFLSSLTFRTY